MSYQKMMAQDLGPAPAVTLGFPAMLDDAALRQMYERRQDFAFSAFYSEREAEPSTRLQWNDLLGVQHQRLPAMRYEATPLGRFDREVDAHYMRWMSGTPESAATLLALLHAAEATLYYDWELATHLWTHARELQPAPVAVFERLDRHLRVIRALHMGAAVTGPVTRGQTMTAAIEVPPGLARAAARAFPDANAGSFDTYGTLPLTVVRGHVVRVHGGAEQVFAAGEGLLLGRLDVLRVPAAATLTHMVLGEFPVAAGSELTAWNVHQWLLPAQRAQVEALVAAMLARDSEARAVLEAMLPAAYFEIRLRYLNVPTARNSEDAYVLMHRFNGGPGYPVPPV